MIIPVGRKTCRNQLDYTHVRRLRLTESTLETTSTHQLRSSQESQELELLSVVKINSCPIPRAHSFKQHANTMPNFDTPPPHPPGRPKKTPQSNRQGRETKKRASKCTTKHHIIRCDLLANSCLLKVYEWRRRATTLTFTQNKTRYK